MRFWLHHPHKQLAERRQHVGVGTGSHTVRCCGKLARREHPKRYILPRSSSFLATARHEVENVTRRVGIDRTLSHHRRLCRGRAVASTVPLVGRIERRQVQGIDHIADVMSQVPWGNPLLQVRRQKQGLVAAGKHETWSASGVPTRNWRIGIILPPAQIHPQPVRYQLCRADLSAAHAPSCQVRSLASRSLASHSRWSCSQLRSSSSQVSKPSSR